MAERFRDLIRPALVDVAARSTPSGSEQAANNLSASLSAFSRTASEIGSSFAADAGAREGQRDGASGELDTRKGLRSLSAYGRAYNDASLRSYAILAENDINDDAARLEVEAGTNPTAFKEAMLESQKGTLAEAPAEAQGVIADIYNRRIGQGTNRINAALATELRNEDRQLALEEVGRLQERVGSLRAQDTAEAHDESELEEAKLFALVEATVADGTLSKTEGRVAINDARDKIVQATVLERFRQELDTPFGDPIGFIQDLKEINRTAEALTPEQEQKLEASLFGELREHNALASAEQAAVDAAAVARMEAGERGATAALFNGSLTQNDLLGMTLNEELDPAIGRTLYNMLKSSSTEGGVSNPSVKMAYEIDLLSYTRQDILNEPSLSFADKSSLIQELEEEAAGWKSTQNAKEAFRRIDASLGILPGVNKQMLDEGELRAAQTAFTQLFNSIEALPPEERDSAVIAASESVIQTVVRNKASDDLVSARQRLEVAINKDTSDMSDREKRILDGDIERFRNRIRELEAKTQGGGQQ